MNGKVIIAAHHYQRPSIVARAALVGDSYRLAVEAGKSDAEYVVLCGVRFMAESAAIFAREGQKVLLPDWDAGCPMADMIDAETARDVLDSLRARTGKRVVPVTYMNSWADLKALTGREGGSICTSGNAKKIVSHFLDQGLPIFFLPDFNLGINTARELGIPDSAIRRVLRDGSLAKVDGDDPVCAKLDAANPDDDVRMFLWDGFCHVHRHFTPEHVRAARERDPSVRVIVHPECKPETVLAADASGSTEAMYRMLKDASDGTSWAIGTEGRFVERMISEFPGKKISHLFVSYCHNMNKIDDAALDATLKAIERHEKNGEPLNAVTIDAKTKADAALALDAMVRVTEAK